MVLKISEDLKNNKRISRAKAVTAVMKIVGVKSETEVKNTGDGFSDILPSDENYKYISAAKDVIALGEGETRRFNPDREITLREFLTVVLRAMKGKDNVSYDNIENDCIDAKLAQKYEFNDYMLESPLEKAEFGTVISRLLAAKRYLYCENGEIKTDNDGKILYREWVLKNNK